MPRTVRLDWHARVRLFKTYRRLKSRAYPTAKEHGVARSTVSSVVRNLIERGFSEKPRPHLSQDTLTLLQHRHLDEVTAFINDPISLAISRPENCVTRSQEAGKGSSLDLPDTLRWHMKGTPAEKLLAEASNALADYMNQCDELWTRVRSLLEARCGISVFAYQEDNEPIEHSCLWTSLVHCAYRGHFHAAFSLKEEWDEPIPSVDERLGAKGLWRRGELMANVLEADQEKFFNGIRAYEDEDVKILRGIAGDLTRLYEDLLYLTPLVKDALETVEVAIIRAGICPSCPHPEAFDEAET